jgi:hypothetical protein
LFMKIGQPIIKLSHFVNKHLAAHKCAVKMSPTATCSSLKQASCLCNHL